MTGVDTADWPNCIEAGLRLGLHRDDVREMVIKGQVRYGFRGANVVVHPDDVAALIAKQEAG